MMDWTLKLSLCCAVYISLISVVASSSSPQVTAGPSYVTVNESFPKGGELVTFRVHDSDPGDIISVRFDSARTSEYVNFTLTGPTNDITVHIYTINELDRDQGVTSVSLQFAITDTQYNQIYNTIDLYITDVNDNHPEFHNLPYSWSIKEHAAVNSTNYSPISATDPDVGNSGQVSFRIEPATQSNSTGQAYADTFHIDPVSGVVKLVKTLDYETNNYYQFTVITEDGGGLSSNTTLVIRVLDVQDTPPFFTGIRYRSTINENVLVGHSVITLTARDGDTGVSNHIDYSIMPGPCSSLFGVDSSGRITTTGNIDRDSGVVYNESGVCMLHVQASETNTSGQPQYGANTSTTDVTVTINDQNDNVPKFLLPSYNASILENMPENVPITIVGSSELSVTDNDQEGNNYATMDITLQYTDGTECHDFTPSPTTVQGSGTIMIRVANKQVLDYEQRHSLTLWVVATEGADHRHVATATVVLKIADMNDNSPQFNDTRNYDFHINENSANGTVVGTITASDADSPQYANVTYSLAGGNAAKFRVDKFTGEITTVCAINCSESFDREKISIYYLTYTATDAGDRSNSKAIVIHLDDVNDNTPHFSRPVYTAFLDENDGQFHSSANPLLTVTATDNDEVNTNNSAIIYTITNVSDQAMRDTFNINDMTGQIFLKKPIDYETLDHTLGGQFYITVEAKDKGSIPRSSSARVDITVQDMGEISTIASLTFSTTSVYETVTSAMTYDGGWSLWGLWSTCSVTCGGGIRTRDRLCDNPAKQCIGNSQIVSHCNDGHCTDVKSAFSVDTPQSIASGKLTFSRENYNYGGGYNASTGIFTCSKPGVYQFSLSLTKAYKRVNYIHCHMFKNSLDMTDIHLDPSDDDTENGQASISYFILLQLKRGDTVSLQNCSPVNTLADPSSFMGFLLYADP